MFEPFGGESNGEPRQVVSSKILRALQLLQEAFDYAQDVQRNEWDFAVEFLGLCQLGLTRNDCRWLVCKGLVLHQAEVHGEPQRSRTFVIEAELSFANNSCFVLSDRGRRFVEQLRDERRNSRTNGGPPEPLSKDNGHEHPVFLEDARELRLGRRLVKRFKLPSPNQETILLAFQEEGWPPRIDDPLPPCAEQLPKRRLLDTIKSLNRHQDNALIRFSGDGTGEGIRWDPIT